MLKTCRILRQTIYLTGEPNLKLEELKGLARGEGDVKLSMLDFCREKITTARKLVDHHVEEENVVYGLTTGFGKLKNVAIAKQDLRKLQDNLVLSHCCGIGEPMPIDEVRIAQVLRLWGLSQGHSGIRLELAEQLIRLFNKQFVPFVPRKGSVGASGDLAPLSHMAAAYMGYGKAYVKGELMEASEALKAVGESPMQLEAKEGLSLINGTEIMKATAVLTLLRAEKLALAADGIAALSLEALMGTATPFAERLAKLKGDAGHMATSHNMREVLRDSEVLASHTKCDRVQDPYSLRCIPIIHGSVKNAIQHVRQVLNTEINSVTDNPIIFPDTGDILSAGHFHGMPVSMAMDYLTLALATLSNVSERRTEQLVNPDLSRMPGFLAPNPGLDSGYMIAQVASAALCSENKVLAHPASVDTIPTSANQEDHVSMGTHSARKSFDVLVNAEHVVAIEYLCAAQGREFHDQLAEGKGTRELRNLLRTVVPRLEGDRFTYTDMEHAAALIRSGDVSNTLQTACNMKLAGDFPVSQFA
eukprot:TRINITY_DN17669_c0_g1_i1.p1 TRINITY_DN17669_c0_g1~~TRINITY_DN17669_c0_g1_i1.p1  ORF type:complete len:531 (+),score=125.32 TRINITY_DN17669_c0_g1_i1:59-1651(+)